MSCCARLCSVVACGGVFVFVGVLCVVVLFGVCCCVCCVG